MHEKVDVLIIGSGRRGARHGRSGCERQIGRRISGRAGVTTGGAGERNTRCEDASVTDQALERAGVRMLTDAVYERIDPGLLHVRDAASPLIIGTLNASIRSCIRLYRAAPTFPVKPGTSGSLRP